jgi:hypothetical protein
MHRRGNQGRHRSNNDAAKVSIFTQSQQGHLTHQQQAKANGNASNNASKKANSQDRGSETTGKVCL